MSVEPAHSRHPYRYFDLITVMFVVVLLVSNLCAIKALRLPIGLPVDIDGGTLLFPLSYIFGDILVEVYGYSRSRRVIWIGFIANMIAALMFALVVAMPAAPGWDLQEPFQTILGQTPRIVAASLIAFLVGEFVNAYVMAKMKVWQQGRHAWWRFIASTVAGQLFDSMLFSTLAFAGVWPAGLIVQVILWNYLVKVGYEALVTPLTTAISRALKRVEAEDYFDYNTNFNPFRL